VIGVTLGVGDGWREVAAVAAQRMAHYTGLQITVVENPIRQYAHPSWAKADVIEMFPTEDSFLVFDADVVCLRHWSPDQLFADLGRPFCAAVERRSQDVFDECAALEISFPDVMVNGGLLMFGREHLPVWEAVRGRHPKCGRWMEQGALNLSLLESDFEVCRLPRQFNTLAHNKPLAALTPDEIERKRVINLHWCGVRDPQKLLEIQKRYGL
jgi:hypothetical protein